RFVFWSAPQRPLGAGRMPSLTRVANLKECRSAPVWRNWQTRWIQNPFPLKGSAGSIPVTGIADVIARVGWAVDLLFQPFCCSGVLPGSAASPMCGRYALNATGEAIAAALRATPLLPYFDAATWK